MHMLSRKDLHSAELETVRSLKVRRRLLLPTAKCKQMMKQQCMSENLIFRYSEAYRRYTGLSLTRKNSGKMSDISTSGPVVRNHNSLKMADE